MDSAQPTPGPGAADHPTQQLPPPPQPTEPPADAPNPTAVRDLADMRRTGQGRYIAGVAGGLARHFNIDPILVRVLLVVLTFFGGAGLVAYVGLWLIVPEDGQAAAPLGLDDRSRRVSVMVLGALAGVVALATVAGSGFDGVWWLGPLALLVGVVLFLSERSRRAHPQQPRYGEVATVPHPYPPQEGAAQTQQFPAPAYGPPAPTASYPVPPPPRRIDPRRRGPILFWFTLALVAVGIGVLGVVDIATDGLVLDSAYPALALGITTAMLLIGAFWGRAGGLIALGLLFAAVTLGVTAGERFEADDITHVPTSASEVRRDYEMHAGSLLLDLREVSDPAALDGREISIEGGAGEVRVLLPEGIDATVEATVGVGESTLLGGSVAGLDTHNVAGADTGADPDVHLTIDLGVGSVVVEQENGTQR